MMARPRFGAIGDADAHPHGQGAWCACSGAARRSACELERYVAWFSQRYSAGRRRWPPDACSAKAKLHPRESGPRSRWSSAAGASRTSTRALASGRGRVREHGADSHDGRPDPRPASGEQQESAGRRRRACFGGTATAPRSRSLTPAPDVRRESERVAWATSLLGHVFFRALDEAAATFTRRPLRGRPRGPPRRVRRRRTRRRFRPGCRLRRRC
jgi:hypothetical protein